MKPTTFCLLALAFVCGCDQANHPHTKPTQTSARPTREEPRDSNIINAWPDDLPCTFTQQPYIHPRIIEDLVGWPSDRGDQVVAINLLDAQQSNRYFGDIETHKTKGQNPFVYSESESGSGQRRHTDRFGYRYIGMTDHGVHILHTSTRGGGSGVFNSLLFVALERDHGIAIEQGTGNRRTLERKRQRILIKALGTYPLGDRWEGDLELTGNLLRVGKDRGWYDVSNEPKGTSHNNEDIVLKLELEE